MKDLKDYKVLVVDDEQDVRDYLSTALEDAGFQVSTASDGQEALEKVQKEKPDAISLDLVMPKHSGMQFYRSLQKNKEWKNIPILIVTGHARDDWGRVDFETLTMQGPGVYLEKPVKPKQYVESICSILKMDVPEHVKQWSDRDTESLRSEIEKTMGEADPEQLQKALDALKKNK